MGTYTDPEDYASLIEKINHARGALLDVKAHMADRPATDPARQHLTDALYAVADLEADVTL
jgi:hypothetical protein